MCYEENEKNAFVCTVHASDRDDVPNHAFAKEEAKTWKFGELSLKAGDVLGKDTEIKNDAENREIRILSEKTNPDEKKDQKDDKERIKTEKEAVIAAAASWNLKDLTEKAKKAPARLSA